MYVIKSWVRDFRDEKTRRGDWSCYREFKDEKTGESFLGIPITKRVGVEGTFIEGMVISTYKFKKDGLKCTLKYIECSLCDDITEIAYIPETREEYNKLESIAKKVIRGDYGNQPLREKLLKKDGYDFLKVQSFVNYLLDGYRLFTKEDWGCGLWI